MNRLFFATIVVLLLFVHTGYAQNISFERIRFEDGLPSDLTKALAKDSVGFIWVATDEGLAKIEGSNFIKATNTKDYFGGYKDVLCTRKFGMVAVCDGGIAKITQDYKGIYADELVDNFPERIFPKNIYEAADSSLWVADTKKVIHIEGEKVTRIEFAEKNHTRSFFRSYQFMELGKGLFFILSQKGFLYSYNKAQDSLIEIPWEYSGTEIFTVHKLNDNEFFVGSAKGLLKISFANGVIAKVSHCDFYHQVYAMEQVDENKWIIGTFSNGAYIMDLHEGKFAYRFINGTEGGVCGVVLDEQKQIWLVTGAGILVGKRNAFHQPFKNDSIGLVVDIKPYHNNALCFADKKAVYKTNNLANVETLFSLQAGEITTIFPTNNGLYIGTNTGQILYKQHNGQIVTHDFSAQGKEIISLVLDENAMLWFIQKRNGKSCLLKMSSKGKVTDFTPHAEGVDLRFLKLSPTKQLYVGAMGFGNYLFKYNADKNTLENLSIPFDFSDEIPLIHDMVFTKDSACLLASENGILEYKDSAIKRLNLGKTTTAAITGIALDALGRLWFGNSVGITCFNEGELLVFGNSDGLQSKTTSFRCLYIDNNNGFWVGSAAGIDYGKLPLEFKSSLSPIITRVENLGLAINPGVKNKFLQNTMLKVNFASANYPAQYVDYQYILSKKGEDGIWEKVEYKQSDLRFDYLDVGAYTLKIKAKNEGHYKWSEPTIYHFKIYKIWYTRPGYIVGLNLLMLCIAYLYFRYLRIKSLKRQKELERAVSIRTEELVIKNQQLVKTQQQLIQSEKMASIGLLAAGIAHEINNPINYISGGIAVLKKSYSKLQANLNAYKAALNKVDADEKNRDGLPHEKQLVAMDAVSVEMFESIEDGISKTKEIVQSIRAFSSKSGTTFSKVNVNDIITSALLMLHSSYKGRIEIIKEYDAQSEIVGVSSNIQQIIMNLLVNAIQALPDKGTILIKTVRNNVQNSFVISIKDNGIGMSKETQKHIFDPFFTTKDVGKGTGLGLYLCYQYVQQHHGEIKTFSEQGVGTEFIVELPINQ